MKRHLLSLAVAASIGLAVAGCDQSTSSTASEELAIAESKAEFQRR